MSQTAYTFTSPRMLSEIIAYEVDPNYTRGDGDFTASGADVDLVIGTPIALVSGAPVVFDATASDGSETIAGICLTSVTVTDGSTAPIVWIEDGPARVVENRIAWPTGTTPAQITAALDVLRAKGIKFITGQGSKN